MRRNNSDTDVPGSKSRPSPTDSRRVAVVWEEQAARMCPAARTESSAVVAESALKQSASVVVGVAPLRSPSPTSP